jgi:fructosamine-3-kinase
MPDWPAIADILANHGLHGDAMYTSIAGGDISDAWCVEGLTAMAGGDVSDAWCAQEAGKKLFLKTGPESAFDMFDAEAAGLRELAAVNAVRVPRVFACGSTDSDAFIAMEWLGFKAVGTESERLLGEQLAALHRYTATQFGWHRNNTIGLTPQINTWMNDWTSFFREHRLIFQLELAAKNGYTGELQTQGRVLADKLPALFVDYVPHASLLHGDLWGGNWAVADGYPVIFDPAVYYGDRETDLAMTRLFGGFGPAFYGAYESSWPLSIGHEKRTSLYQLYHILNHLNIFGESYRARAVSMMSSLLRQIS